MKWQLQGFDRSEFIQQYWQKKPCLIRQAIPGFQSPISPEELAGLACEEEVHSRLIIEKDAHTPWELSYGPFQEEVFLALPETHYSLLVSECEKWIPELTGLIEQFRFIPDWRIDDLMVSYAPPGGSVGPHSDEYDVFLLQAQGNRKWQYTDDRVENPALIPGLDLAIMQNFKCDQEEILLPGDMLYLPPGIAHHGVAVDACLTFSIGFRAPTAIEVLESFVLEVSRQDSASKRYSDPDLETNRHFAEITQSEIDRFKAMILSLMDQPESLWVDSVGKLLSDSLVADDDADSHPARPHSLFNNNWVVNSDSRMLYRRGDSDITFYCNGRGYKLPNTKLVIEAIQNLCELRFLSATSIDAYRPQKLLIAMLSDLEKSGVLLSAEE
jgi:50S ribosomal protein L16 3-hydroxylase